MNEFFCELGGSAAHCTPAMDLVRMMFSALLAILFLQSGLDKVFDRQGNLDWLTGHFSKTPLKGTVPLMLSTITMIELAAGVVSALGVGALALMGSRGMGLTGVLLSALALLSLFFGQRIAKDYEGAATLAAYFTLVMVGSWLYVT